MSSASSDAPELLEIGRIGKPHGLSGKVFVSLISNRIKDRTRPGAVFWVDGRKLEVKSARLHSKGSNGDTWLFSFVGLTKRDSVEALRGLLVTAEPIDEPDELFVHTLVGLMLVDGEGIERGEVVAIVANPASDLLELDDGALVPLRFHQSHDERHIHVDVPPGLFEDSTPT